MTSSPHIANEADSKADAALRRLSELLHEKMEHLDPGSGDWCELSEDDRDFYRTCIDWLMCHRPEVRQALDLADQDEIGRRAHLGE